MAVGSVGESQWLKPASIRMELVGASSKPHLLAEDAVHGRINFFMGSDPAAWRTGVRRAPIIEQVLAFLGFSAGTALADSSNSGQARPRPSR